MKLTTQFKVISVSENTNSFGLHGVIICDKSGLAFEVGIAAWCCPKKGNIVTGEITDKGNLVSLAGISYELPRTLDKPDAATLREMFPDEPKKTKLVNVAKGKKIKNTLDFATVFGDLDVTKKTAVIKNIQQSLETGITARGTKMTTSERPAVEQLLRWCNVNLLVGNELCPPANINQY